MLPDDSFNVIAEEVSDDFYFHLDYKEKDVLLWVEGKFSALSINQKEKPLECGYNRQAVQ